jgi:hypothetical protein
MRATKRFADTAMERAVIKGRNTEASRGPQGGSRTEWHGSPLRMVMHEPKQTGVTRSPHGVPPGYEHPLPLGPDVLEPGGPRILPVSQKIEYGPEKSREEEFERAVGAGLNYMASYFGDAIFKDRRLEGRRYRETDTVDEL